MNLAHRRHLLHSNPVLFAGRRGDPGKHYLQHRRRPDNARVPENRRHANHPSHWLPQRKRIISHEGECFKVNWQCVFLISNPQEVQILKALVLGEEERGQSQYQVMCFATKFNKGDFISSAAMAKLRQKNPHTIRTPEEDKGRETYTMSSWVQLNRSLPITRHLQGLCAEATDATYVRDVDLKAWAELPGEFILMDFLDNYIKAFLVFGADSVSFLYYCSLLFDFQGVLITLLRSYFN